MSEKEKSNENQSTCKENYSKVEEKINSIQKVKENYNKVCLKQDSKVDKK
jgi:hypothetical protein